MTLDKMFCKNAFDPHDLVKVMFSNALDPHIGVFISWYVILSYILKLPVVIHMD